MQVDSLLDSLHEISNLIYSMKNKKKYFKLSADILTSILLQ